MFFSSVLGEGRGNLTETGGGFWRVGFLVVAATARA